MVSRSPVFRSTRGSHPSNVFARVISGRRRWGSSPKPFGKAGNQASLVSGEFVNQQREIPDADFVRVADIYRFMLFREHQTVNTFHQVTDVAKTAGLCPVSVDRQGFAVQRLLDEVWHHASVIQAHAGAKGIENPDDCGYSGCETRYPSSALPRSVWLRRTQSADRLDHSCPNRFQPAGALADRRTLHWSKPAGSGLCGLLPIQACSACPRRRLLGFDGRLGYPKGEAGFGLAGEGKVQHKIQIFGDIDKGRDVLPD